MNGEETIQLPPGSIILQVAMIPTGKPGEFRCELAGPVENWVLVDTMLDLAKQRLRTHHQALLAKGGGIVAAPAGALGQLPKMNGGRF